MAGELHREVAGKAIGALDQDRPHAVAGDPVEHRLEAGALVDRVSPRHHVVELGDDLIAIARGEAGDREPLPLVLSLSVPMLALVGDEVRR